MVGPACVTYDPGCARLRHALLSWRVIRTLVKSVQARTALRRENCAQKLDRRSLFEANRIRFAVRPHKPESGLAAYFVGL